MHETAEQITQRHHELAAFKMGRRDALRGKVSTGALRGTPVPGDVPQSDALRAQYDAGVEEGKALLAMTVEERLRIIMDYYGSVDPAAQEDIPRQVKLGNRYITVTQDDDDDYYLASYETLDDVWDGLADEITGERSWWPCAIFDLHTGETIPYGVTVKVWRGEDGALGDELTSHGIE